MNKLNNFLNQISNKFEDEFIYSILNINGYKEGYRFRKTKTEFDQFINDKLHGYQICYSKKKISILNKFINHKRHRERISYNSIIKYQIEQIINFLNGKYHGWFINYNTEDNEDKKILYKEFLLRTKSYND